MIQTIIIQTISHPLRRAFGRILLNTVGIALLLPGIAQASGTVQYVYGYIEPAD